MIDLSKLSDLEIYSLWKKGLNYWQAEAALASDELKARKNQVIELKAKHREKETNKVTDKQSPHHSIAGVLTALFISPHDEELTNIEKEFHNNILRAISEERLIALGYNFPRNASDSPVKVPIDLIAYKIPKSKILSPFDNTFQKGSLKMVEVRFIWRRFVVDALSEPEHMINSKPNENMLPVRNKAGRPTTKHIILLAYGECVSLREIDFTLYKKDAAYVVRSYIKTTSPKEFGTGKGFSEQTIIKYISKDFDTNKLKNNKI